MKFFKLEKTEVATVLKIDRQEALNALNTEVIAEFSEGLNELAKQGGIRCLVVTGAGEKAFIAGADIKEMSSMTPAQALEFSYRAHALTRKIEGFPAPVIAAVNGFALGGGCEVAISCDFILASTKAVFGFPEVGLGLIPGAGGIARTAEFVGWPMARELIYTGRRIKADEALRVGLANKVFEPEQLMPGALAVAAEIGQNSPASVRAAKFALQKIRTSAMTITERLETEAQTFSNLFGTPEQVEGTKAFIEKRKPVFKG